MKRWNRAFQTIGSVLFAAGVGAIVFGCATQTPKASPNPEDQKLTAVIEKYSAAQKRIDAYDAPYFGVEENLDKFGDFLTLEQRERQHQLVKTAMSDLQTVDPSKLSSAQSTAYALFRGDIEKALEDFKFRLDYFSFNQMYNRLRSYIDDSSPDLTSFPFDSTVHYRAFLKRSEGFPAFVDRQIANLKEGAKAGYALNCTVAKSAIESYKSALEPVVEKNPFYRPVLKMPAAIEKKDQDELSAGFAVMVKDRILPAFQKFDRFYKNEYLKMCRTTYGLSKVPQGAALYKNAIRDGTDLTLDPKEIHETGLREVARIRKEMLDAFKALGYKGSYKQSITAIKNDPKSYFNDVASMQAAYDAYRSKVTAEIPKAFSLQPKTDFKIVESENPEEASGSYRDPTDFVPYGRFIINTKNLKATPKWGIYTLFLHEAIPGHHFHMALQYEMKELSEYQRKMFYSNSFSEGWALYAERWGREAGLVSEPAHLIGSLADEMLRAVRLVVDTGIHSYGWSREKVMTYMAENLPSDKREIQIEADRYSVWPGQALGYKIGQLKILELREKAKHELGAKFDLKDFHRVVIGSGTVSLPVLESKVNAWIQAAKTAKLARANESNFGLAVR